MILGKGLEKPLVAEIVAETVGNDFFTPDYALLKATGTGGLPYLALTDRAQKLQDVVAAGYPGLLTETDEDIQRLATGDMQSMPEPSVTSGVVTAKQSPRGVPLLVHTATISGGSSGGPLVDECGRVVGMNTFVRNSQKDGGRMNYALATPSLAAFLQQHQVPLTLNSQACVVQTQQAREDKEAAPEANEKTGTGGEEEPK
ncbi:MAG: trypsin-like peptidase domain-containing protein [Rhodospirillales bacterium]|nr:trypsin-like peptidase domain-containing protein [Rhodospirillales bacterium]